MFSDIVSRMYFKKSDYDSLDELFDDVSKQINILTKNKNSVVFYQFQDATNIFVLEYSPIYLDEVDEEPQFPMWLNSDELLTVQASRIADRIENIEKTKENLEKAKDGLVDLFADTHSDDDKNSGGGQA